MTSQDEPRAEQLRALSKRVRNADGLTPQDRKTLSRLALNAARAAATTKTPHGDDTLREAAFHVAYEFAMLRLLAHLVKTNSASSVLTVNLVVESALLHARNLDDFFRKADRSRADDVIARDFAPTWSPRPLLRSEERTSLNKHLAHMTTARRKGRAWRITEWAETASQIVNEFNGTLTPDRLDWFTNAEAVLSDGADD